MAGPLHGLPPLPPPLPIIPPCVQPPRPPNSWILYRAWKLKNMPPAAPGEGRRNQADVSTVISDLWKDETIPIRAYFDRLADEAKQDHAKKYPNYRYQPKKKVDKAKAKAEAKAKAPPRKRAAKSKSKRGISDDVSTPAHPVMHAAHPYAHPSRQARDAYDRMGPSPPLSAASSPTTVSSPLPIVFSHPYLDSISSTAVAPFAAVPSSPFVPVMAAPASYTPSVVDETFSLPPSAPLETHQWDLVDQGVSPEYNHYVSQEWDQQFTAGVETQPALFFNVPFQQSADWTVPELTCGHLANEQHTINCFLQDFPVASSVEQQQGELEVSIGSLPTAMYPLSNDGLYPQDGTSLPFNIDPDFSQPGQQEFGDIFFDVNANYDFSYGEDAPVNFATAPSEAPVEGTSYVPPSGAAQSSTRRVAGNWANYVQDIDESAEHYKVTV